MFVIMGVFTFILAQTFFSQLQLKYVIKVFINCNHHLIYNIRGYVHIKLKLKYRYY